MTYFGGKGSPGVAQTLINQIPAHDRYISAFAGHDHVLQIIRRSRATVVIDRDPESLKFWATANVALFQADAIDWLRHEFDLDRIDAAAGVARSSVSGSGSGVAADSDLSSFIMIDPPYPSWTRSSSTRYRHDADGLCDHVRILETTRKLAAIPAGPKMMVCSYPNAIYDNALCDWRSLNYKSVVRSGAQRTERIWMNYSEPARLHDYRFVGNNKRGREKIRRRIRNLIDGLEKRPPREREAVLEAIRDKYFDAEFVS